MIRAQQHHHATMIPDYEAFVGLAVDTPSGGFVPASPPSSAPPPPARGIGTNDIYICQIKTPAGLWAGLLNGKHVARYTVKLAALGGFSCTLISSQDAAAFKRVCALLDPHRNSVSFGNLRPLLAEQQSINQEISAHFAECHAWASDWMAPLSPGQELGDDEDDDGNEDDGGDDDYVDEGEDEGQGDSEDEGQEDSDSSDFAPRPRPATLSRTLSRKQARRDREGALGESDAEGDADSDADSDHDNQEDDIESDDDDDDGSDSLPIGFDDDHLFKGKRLPRHLVQQARKKRAPLKKKSIIVEDLDSNDEYAAAAAHSSHTSSGSLMFHYTPAFDFAEHADALSSDTEKAATCLVPSTARTQQTSA